jgi:maltose alpha-D-glucosyltransferase / alpha-amylase
MPGTPVLYYGDEIGMGDNVHLGDRDGVRTPMQWSSDRNGGFSRADPASLVLPPIQDPLYGYQAVNVEAQWRDPHSLLNWTRRMLVVRRQHKAFGRGVQRFLRPANRKVLAYLREFQGESILCVANVSRSAQAVELDLAEFAGRVPVELSGGAAFPKIGALTYLLTLPPYGFAWFLLSAEAEAPAWSSATAGPLTEHHTFVLRTGLLDITSGAARHLLQNEVLPAYIGQRRWFQNKDEGVGAVEINAFDALPGAGQEAMFVELCVHVSDRIERYTLPLTVAWEDAPSFPFEAPLALARVRRGRRVGLLTDAFASPVLPRAMLRGLLTEAVVELSSGGRIICRPTSALAKLDISDSEEIHWPGAEQTNSTLLVGRIAVMKLFRRLTAGIHPEGEMSRLLTERGFSGVPALLGDIVRIGVDGQEYMLAVIQSYVDNQGDGWDWSLRQMERIVDEEATPFGTDEAAVFTPYETFARTLGRRVGEMHAILAQPDENPDFAPEQATDDDERGWRDQARAELEAAFATLASRTDLDEHARAAAATLATHRDAMFGFLETATPGVAHGIKIRIHGDLHLGQVLVAAADVQIIDFEGEPRKPLALRRAKASPLRDLAGLIRSFDYVAAQVARTARLTTTVDAEARVSELLAGFRTMAVTAMLTGYAEGAGDALPPIDQGLLDMFTLEKAAYEIGYEAANRPDWLGVPVRGLAALVKRMFAGAKA